MIPLVDIHCHLLPGLDDGPKTDAEAVETCRISYADGIRVAAATVHQNTRYPAVNPERIREATHGLTELLREAGIPLMVFPAAEVLLHPEVETFWREGQLLSMADRKHYLLLEMPHGLAPDIRGLITGLREAGVRPILAHPERHPELLHETERMEQLIQAGCLVQVSSGSITEPPSRSDVRLLKNWFRRRLVHFVGSDGHSPTRRPPRMAEAYRQITAWAGRGVADQVCSTHGLAILHGLPLRLPEPERLSRRWFTGFWPRRAIRG